MDQTRFDRLTRVLARTGSRRAAIAAAVTAIAGGAIVASSETGAQACVARGGSCASGTCCAGTVCDAKAKKCLSTAGGSCAVSSQCAGGLKCKSGKCDGAIVCRGPRESCLPNATNCCAGHVCDTRKKTCLALAGSACTSTPDCVSGLVCLSGSCQTAPTPTPTPTPPPPCPEPGEIGDSCDLAGDCRTLTCVNGECAAPEDDCASVTAASYQTCMVPAGYELGAILTTADLNLGSWSSTSTFCESHSDCDDADTGSYGFSLCITTLVMCIQGSGCYPQQAPQCVIFLKSNDVCS